MSPDLATTLGRKAKELVEGMKKRAGREPDVADYAAAFRPILLPPITILLRDAEQDIQSAIAEGGLSPAHERMIDAMQKIVAYLALKE